MTSSLSLWILNSFVQLREKEAISIICLFKIGHPSIPYPQIQYFRTFHMSRIVAIMGFNGKFYFPWDLQGQYNKLRSYLLDTSK
ncbi:hypothetical protein PR202_gb22832 [Eleusine coracana subsp. coracana]|uniref:Uncharacterized protein n=1 Tax=Eleusine coracana subsp. coracana TaxID=191504 RepID=A0AAV5FH64_ELECO|nr:hypothetical protein PR202_gb22832 [Eleusine coracana subsp. coracana]